MMTEKILEIKQVGKKYNIAVNNSQPSTLREMLTNKWKGLVTKNGKEKSAEFWALKDINIDIYKGEKVGLIGKNGAGKSTLLKLISRITKPTEGSLTISGRVASLLEVGTGFHPELSGKENIFLNASILGMHRNEIKERFDEIVAFSEIGDFLETPVKHYSSGMYVKLAFAVAAHINPDLLIIDEVLAVGDVAFQKKCLNRMNDLQKDGRTVLFVSHNMVMVQEFCDRAVLLNGGRVVADGSPNDILAKYSDLNDSDKNGFIDLAEHRGRLPSMTPCLKSLQLRNDKLEAQPDFLQTENVIVDVSYENSLGMALSGMELWVYTLSGIRIGELSTFSSQQAPFSIPSKGIIRFQINANLFLPNSYTIRLAAKVHQTSNLDCIENVINFEIKAADVFKNNYFVNSSHGLINISGSYSVLEEA